MAASATSQVPEQCVQDNFKQSELKRRILVQCDLIKADTCSGFSAVSHSDKAIILSFRGSDGDEIFLEIVDAIFERPVSAFDGRGKVLYYFLTAFSKVWENGMKDDFISLNNTYPDYELWITGHSLGGAMASIAATTIATTNLFDAKKIKLVTFGQPRTGDESYAALVDLLIPYAIRVVHRDDIVPLIPPGFLYGYRHHKSEVWYDNDMSINDTFQECDEDESNQCRDGKFAFDIKDHDKYFDVGVGMAQDGCKGWNPYV
uniref:Fungal lipase-like domain-containing protein n=1 Tax=Panagrolaimus davidi TaxID=227884 RepID=A0A914QUM1_9BILA